MFRVVDRSLPQAPTPGGVHGKTLGGGPGLAERGQTVLSRWQPLRSVLPSCAALGLESCTWRVPLPLSTCGGLVQISLLNSTRSAAELLVVAV